MVTVSEIKSDLEVKSRPTSVAQLVQAFVPSLQEDPEQALIDYVDWEVVPEADKFQALGGMLTLAISLDRKNKHHLQDSNVYTFREYEEGDEEMIAIYNQGKTVPVTHLLELVFKQSENVTSTCTIVLANATADFICIPTITKRPLFPFAAQRFLGSAPKYLRSAPATKIKHGVAMRLP